MLLQKSFNLALAGLVTMLAAALLLVTVNVSAQEANRPGAAPGASQEEPATEPASEETEAVSNTSNFDFVAQQGDSYSLMARKAVQIFGINNTVELSGAQIIYVETNLTQAAGSPRLNLGQKVTVDGNMLAEWIKKAQALTEAQQALWQTYADNADFNTNAIGEAPAAE